MLELAKQIAKKAHSGQTDKAGVPYFGHLEAVAAITKMPDEKYEVYLKRVKHNSIATAVKLADLKHNMRVDRLLAPTKNDLKRVEKYKSAYEFLSMD